MVTYHVQQPSGASDVSIDENIGVSSVTKASLMRPRGMSVEEMQNAICAILRSEGVAVFGMGPSDALAREPTGYRPQDVLPGTKGMVCFGIPVPRAVYGATLRGTEMIWRSQNLHYRRLDTLTLRVAQVLEESGNEAAPAFGCCPMGVNGRGEVQGYLNMIRMAERLGLGRIGRNGLLVHARYGSRLMLGGLVTTADLLPVRGGSNPGNGCPDGCRQCADACPVRAIHPETRRVRVMTCLAYTSRTHLLPRVRFGLLCRLDPGRAARLLNQTAFDDHTWHTCSRCVQACPLGKEVSI